MRAKTSGTKRADVVVDADLRADVTRAGDPAVVLTGAAKDRNAALRSQVVREGV